MWNFIRLIMHSPWSFLFNSLVILLFCTFSFCFSQFTESFLSQRKLLACWNICGMNTAFLQSLASPFWMWVCAFVCVWCFCMFDAGFCQCGCVHEDENTLVCACAGAMVLAWSLPVFSLEAESLAKPKPL